MFCWRLFDREVSAVEMSCGLEFKSAGISGVFGIDTSPSRIKKAGDSGWEVGIKCAGGSLQAALFYSPKGYSSTYTLSSS